MLALLAGLVGLVVGAVVVTFWHRRDNVARVAWRELRRQRRQDRVREAVVLAHDNLAYDERRALRWARRALRLQPCNAEAHAAMGSCRSALEHYGQALVHHRRAEELGSGKRGMWRVENALDAAQACLRLREEAGSEAEAQALWDEAHAWMRLAHDLDPDEAAEAMERSPWLAGTWPRETWLRP